MDEQNYLELHYYLKNHDHNMNAELLNKAEAEFIKIIYEIAELLEVKVKANSLPKKEGGITTFFEFIIENKASVVAIGYTVGSFFTPILKTVISDVIADRIKSNSKAEKLKKEDLKLGIEVKRKQLEKLSSEEQPSQDFEKIKNELSILIAEMNKIKIAKSNFYRNLSQDEKVYQFGTRVVNSDLDPISPETIVPRADFSKFIIDEADIESSYNSQIKLEVVSPVLKKSRTSWKGMYADNAFSFRMMDKKFQQMVIKKNLNFSNGTTLICDLEIKQRMDSDGEIKIKGYDVYDVTQIEYASGDTIDIFHSDE